MAKLSPEEWNQMRLAYDWQVQRSGRVRPSSGNGNMHPWGSPLWRAWELGDFIHEKGMTLGARDHWERARGNAYRNADGLTLKLWFSKAGGFGITREA